MERALYSPDFKRTVFSTVENDKNETSNTTNYFSNKSEALLIPQEQEKSGTFLRKPFQYGIPYPKVRGSEVKMEEM